MPFLDQSLVVRNVSQLRVQPWRQADDAPAHYWDLAPVRLSSFHA